MTPTAKHTRPRRRATALLATTVLTTTLALVACTGAAQAASPPVKETLVGGFVLAGSPGGIAVNNDPASPQAGDVYVADGPNSRVQVLTPTGGFVMMFGWEVNQTKDAEPAATQAEKNVCTAASADVCTTGVGGSGAGQFGEEVDNSVAVDPGTGAVYVEDRLNWRVQEFTSEGRFLLMIGKHVDSITEGNVCTAASGDPCEAGEQNTVESTESGAFNFARTETGVLAAGGPEHLLYVGDEHRVQEFKSDGTPVLPGIPLTSISSAPESAVQALTVDESGDAYLTYGEEGSALIRRFNPAGTQTADFPQSPRQPNALEFRVRSLAVDPSGRLAVGERETGAEPLGSLLDAGSGRLITEFAVPSSFGPGAKSLAFNAAGEMYATSSELNDPILAYKPLPVGELVIGPAACGAGAASESDATFSCNLSGEANPWSVPQTEVWFRWGPTHALAFETQKQPVVEVEPNVPVPVHATVTGLRPNETYFTREVGEDQNVKAPDVLRSEVTSFTTPSVAPQALGEPNASFVGAFSAVLFGELNPENTTTRYEFQYGACEDLEACPGALQTPVAEAPTYGRIGTTVEVQSLRPATVYHYRLLASSTGGTAAGPEGSFLTAPAQAVQAMTGGASMVTASSAVIAGSVNPDGQAASYAFELGVYNAAGTQYGIAASGSAGAGTVPVGESLGLSGLLPDTTYAYRIVAHSGDGSGAGQAATGETLTFTTPGLPSLLASPSPPALLAVPPIAFPTEAKATTVRALTNKQKLAKALKACKRRPRKQRGACERRARGQYARSKQAKVKQKG
jgi:hypothetical protein